ncbi:MAG TPA: hypothetical protein PK325_16445 [Cyclobacteriaceae bacterium]|nr:hypothetical protein [Cyclobacteriaceae bacterium]HMV08615.1 hypothetical protein [Cyclobacteriaceae bacterium]HMV90582.1 hypothetical protein [Cyclobacteriaceae bacterium]HMX00176.1 hypothetical protein [Cyclobacteriaceae bacterium]HMX52268.1 hypothetical protein [Cyclobacteriaceae bacterium]
MKPLKKLIPAVLMLFLAVPAFSTEAIPATNTSATETNARAEVLINRLEEIKAMDHSSMTRKEKRALRKEVKSIEKELKQIDEGGVYISVGGIIIILLLLILLL